MYKPCTSISLPSLSGAGGGGGSVSLNELDKSGVVGGAELGNGELSAQEEEGEEDDEGIGRRQRNGRR